MAKTFIEERKTGDFAVRKAKSKRASAVEPTQSEAIVKRSKVDNSGKEICQSGFDSELIRLPGSGNSLIVGNFGE